MLACPSSATVPVPSLDGRLLVAVWAAVGPEEMGPAVGVLWATPGGVRVSDSVPREAVDPISCHCLEEEPTVPSGPQPDGALEDTAGAAADVLRDLMRSTGLSLAEVARLAGLPLLVMAEWTAGRRQPTLGELIRVVKACGLELRLQLATRDRRDH